MIGFVTKNSRRAISAGIAVAVIVVIIISVSAGAYVALYSDNSSVTSSSTTTGNAVISSTSETSSSSSSSSSSSTLTTSSQTSTTTSSSQPSIITSSTTSSTSRSTTSSEASNKVTSTTSSGTTTTLSCPTNETTTTTETQSTTSYSTELNSTFDSQFFTYPELVNLFSNYSSMAIRYGMAETMTTPNSNFSFSSIQTYSYSVIAKPNSTSDLYVVNYTSPSFLLSQDESGTAYFAKNGTVTKLILGNETLTGFNATMGILYFAPFIQEANASSVLPIQMPWIIVLNSTNVNIGGTQVHVTNYGLPELPFSVSVCGQSFTFTAFLYQIGQVSGVKAPLLTYYVEEGTFDGYSASTFFQVIAVSK